MLGLIKARVGLLGLMGLLLVGLLAPITASANPGPMCYHRAINGQGKGELIKAQTPEQFAGEGGEQKLEGKIGGAAVTITSKTAQVKGIIYNNELQCQSKIEIHYQEPKLEPEIKGCEVKVGTNNNVTLFGHLDWTWDGTQAQLEEQPQQHQKPDWLFIPYEFVKGEEELKKAEFTIITLSGGGCGVLIGKFPVTGSASGAIKPPNLGEWGTKEEVNVEKGEASQHDWNGTKYVGFTTGLAFAGTPASYKGGFTLKTIGRQQLAPQEIVHWEGP